MDTPRVDAAARESPAPIVVHSHLRWDFVWQRPQQLLSRMSASAPVLFAEEAAFDDGVRRPRLDLSSPMEQVWRVIPVMPGALRDHYDVAALHTRELLGQLMSSGPLSGRFDRPVLWFYTPMPAPAMLGAFDERAVVYDCMDELSQFRFAPAELVDREKLLVSEADVVFTGGLRLFEAKARRHTNVHFFGCGVDARHFEPRETTATPSDLRFSQTRTIGYYGVIDERLDYELLAALAAALPDVAIAMIGPVVKVRPEELPQTPNIHWLGSREYSELPAYAAGFDVCLMPFALNAATEYINPTKTLEYMAAGKPIVSTTIADVVRQFGSIVAVGHSHSEFIEHVRTALATPNAGRIARGVETARQYSWDSVVEDMQEIVAAAVRTRATVRLARRDAVQRRRTESPTASEPAVRPKLRGEF
jgi:glycosyltransferase involved in cell wall biosynthesis